MCGSRGGGNRGTDPPPPPRGKSQVLKVWKRLSNWTPPERVWPPSWKMMDLENYCFSWTLQKRLPERFFLSAESWHPSPSHRRKFLDPRIKRGLASLLSFVLLNKIVWFTLIRDLPHYRQTMGLRAGFIPDKDVSINPEMAKRVKSYLSLYLTNIIKIIIELKTDIDMILTVYSRLKIGQDWSWTSPVSPFVNGYFGK